MTLGERIRAAREAKGWTLEKLAAESGSTKSFLSEVENGKSNITVNRCAQVARKLDVSLDFLVGGKEVSYECPFCKGTGVL